MDKTYGSIDKPLLAGYIEPTVPPLLKPATLSIRWIEIIMILFGICGSIGVGVMPLAFYYFFGQLIGQLTPDETSPESLEQVQEDVILNLIYNHNTLFL